MRIELPRPRFVTDIERAVPQIWDLRTGGIFETVKYDHAITSLQFDTRKVVSAAGENGVKVRYMILRSQQSVYCERSTGNTNATYDRSTTARLCSTPRSLPMAIRNRSRGCGTWTAISCLAAATRW
jgi:hypothetical protein